MNLSSRLHYLLGDVDSMHLLVGTLIVLTAFGGIFWQASHASVMVKRVAPKGVALIDELSLTNPDPGFIDTLNNTVRSAGYWLAYFPPSTVHVQLFWALPALGYDLVFIRAHSTGWVPGDKITIFTTQMWTNGDFRREQLQGYLYRGGVGPGQFFTVAPKFISDESNGAFPGSIIVMMGCTGLITTQMASAFTSKGARAYIGWYGPVTVSETDAATLSLAQSLLNSKMTLKSAVTQASIVAAEPATYEYNGYTYQGGMGYYPATAGSISLTSNDQPSKGPAT